MSDDVFALLDLNRGSMLDANSSSERARSTSMKRRVNIVFPLTSMCVWNEIYFYFLVKETGLIFKALAFFLGNRSHVQTLLGSGNRDQQSLIELQSNVSET